MLSEKCSDPYCNVCRPQTATSSNASLGSMPSWFGTGTITMGFDAAREAAAKEIVNAFKISLQDLSLPKQNKEQSMSPVAQRVIADLQSLDEKDFPAISKEIDNIKARRKDSLEENLDGVARMAILDKSTKVLRPFVVSYFKDGRVSTTQGVELGLSNLVNENEEAKEYRVFTFGRDYPVSGTYYTMNRFEKALEDSNIPYALVYRKNED